MLDTLNKKNRYSKYSKYNVNGFDKSGIHKNGTLYDDRGYNRFKRDKNGYNELGFNHKNIHRNGTKYDDLGYDIDGYNKSGYDENGECKYCCNNPCDCPKDDY
jgi:hypothetical protein